MTNNRHKISYCIKCGLVDLNGNLSECPFCNNSISTTESFFDEICEDNDFSSKDEIEEYVRQNYVYFDESFNETLMEKREQQSNLQKRANYFDNKFLNDSENNPTCPTCGSCEVERIPSSDKIAGGLMLGIFSSNVRKTMRCNNCGYKW